MMHPYLGEVILRGGLPTIDSFQIFETKASVHCSVLAKTKEKTWADTRTSLWEHALELTETMSDEQKLIIGAEFQAWLWFKDWLNFSEDSGLTAMGQ